MTPEDRLAYLAYCDELDFRLEVNLANLKAWTYEPEIMALPFPEIWSMPLPVVPPTINRDRIIFGCAGLAVSFLSAAIVLYLVNP